MSMMNLEIWWEEKRILKFSHSGLQDISMIKYRRHILRRQENTAVTPDVLFQRISSAASVVSLLL